MALLRASGGIGALVRYMTRTHGLIRSRRSALLFGYLIGIVVFIESSITSLIVGAVSRPLCARYGITRAELAYLCDSTSAPVCSLIVFNGWGALILGVITTQSGAEGATALLFASVLHNFYAFSALMVLFAVIWFDWRTPSMRRSASYDTESSSVEGGKLGHLFWPFGVMMVSVFATLWITGEGQMMRGSGSSAIFYAMVVTLFLMAFLYRGVLDARTWIAEALKGARSMVPMTAVLFLAFMIGDVTRSLHTGVYLAGFVSGWIDPALLPALIFVLSGAMAFATGTSWGTFGIMIPIAMAMGLQMELDTALLIGAAISGGVFGDHCSPISDTSVIASLASGCDHIEHVQTQMPYALLSGLLALGAFVFFGVYDA
ncbi:MAG: sodium:proton antiporter [Campylobacterales bacterium]|nr:sodium:proton antiporter [Campylobacterales bacterium]